MKTFISIRHWPMLRALFFPRSGGEAPADHEIFVDDGGVSDGRSTASVQLEISDERRAESKPGFFQQHFPAILTALITLFGLWFTYVFDKAESQKLELSKDHFAKTLALQKQDLELRKENLESAKLVAPWVKALTADADPEAETAAIALALGGRTNIELLAALLGSPIANPSAVVRGLEVANLNHHASVCAALCDRARRVAPSPANSRAVGAYAKAFLTSRCLEARPLLEHWRTNSEGERPHGEVVIAINKLSEGLTVSAVEPSKECKS